MPLAGTGSPPGELVLDRHLEDTEELVEGAEIDLIDLLTELAETGGDLNTEYSEGSGNGVAPSLQGGDWGYRGKHNIKLYYEY